MQSPLKRHLEESCVLLMVGQDLNPFGTSCRTGHGVRIVAELLGQLSLLPTVALIETT